MFSLFNFSTEEWLRILAMLPVIFFAITVHELSHAWVAVRRGDPTPQQQGRLTLNPVAHFDPFGLMFILITVISGFGIGWGKPVMINPANFRDPRRDEFWVAAAGPLSNIAQATVFAVLSPFVFLLVVWTGQWEDAVLVRFVQYVSIYGVSINLALAFFNMIPLFPLDGEKVRLHSLPLKQADKLAGLRPYGMPILLGTILIGQMSEGWFNPVYWWIKIFSSPLLGILHSLSGWISEILFRWFA